MGVHEAYTATIFWVRTFHQIHQAGNVKEHIKEIS